MHVSETVPEDVSTELPAPEPVPARARGLRAELARTFVATLGRIDHPGLLVVALPRVEALIPPGEAGLALLLEFAGLEAWPARYVAARWLGERSAAAGGQAPERAWPVLLRLADDTNRWVREGAAWGLGALLCAGPERWGPELLAAFLPETQRSEGVRRALLFATVPAIQHGPEAARAVALELLDRAAGVDAPATRQLGALIVGRELAQHCPQAALELVERWAGSGERARRWQAARALTPAVRAIAPDRTQAMVAQLEQDGDPAVRNALRGVLEDDEAPPAQNDPPAESSITARHASPAGRGTVQPAAPTPGAGPGPAPPPDWRTTADIPISHRLIDQVIGQDRAVEIVRLAAQQRRFVLMVGEPGTGKSMLAAAMTEMMGARDLEDILVLPNPESRISPRIEVVPAGEGERIVHQAKRRRGEAESAISYLFWIASAAVSLISGWYALTTKSAVPGLVGGVVFLGLLVARRFFRSPARLSVPKLLVNNARQLETDQAPFIDATGFHAGALLGDVRHDPFQSGGYETPPHELVEPGAIHLAHRGVLFIDEVSTLSIESQQSLLTAIQEKRFPISGRTLGSSGTMIRTSPVPCDFLLILAGNMQDVEKMHPALRSRVRGYGYEIYMNEDMPDTPENRARLAQFCAQEVVRDGKIPHLTRAAVEVVIAEARLRAGRPDRLTTRLRELGGLVRAAGDLAVQEGAPFVEPWHVLAARENTLTLEEQIRRRAVVASGAVPTPAGVPRLDGSASRLGAPAAGQRPAGAVPPGGAPERDQPGSSSLPWPATEEAVPGGAPERDQRRRLPSPAVEAAAWPPARRPE